VACGAFPTRHTRTVETVDLHAALSHVELARARAGETAVHAWKGWCTDPAYRYHLDRIIGDFLVPCCMSLLHEPASPLPYRSFPLLCHKALSPVGYHEADISQSDRSHARRSTLLRTGRVTLVHPGSHRTPRRQMQQLTSSDSAQLL
jgi:hypothetical protein